jgi:chromosome partitioning protein
VSPSSRIYRDSHWAEVRFYPPNEADDLSLFQPLPVFCSPSSFTELGDTMNTHIIAIANQKGGVAKTTSTIALGGLLAEDQPCLVIDLDPQGNLTTGLGCEIQDSQLTTYEVITKRCALKDAIVKTNSGLHLVPSDISLAQGDRELLSTFEAHYFLRDQLETVSKDFPFILIDCPPSLGILTYSALVAATDILIPAQCEFFSMKGIEQLMETIAAVQARANPDLNILGILPTMAQKTAMTDDTISNLKALSKETDIQVFDIVPRSINFAYSNLAGQPIHIFASREKKLIKPYKQIATQLLRLVEA